MTVAIPVLVLMFLGIHRHYRRTSRRLRAGAAADHRLGAAALDGR